MPTDPSCADARAQLEALVASPGPEIEGLARMLRGFAPAAQTRAAVLILFGALDDRAAARASASVSSTLDVLLLARATTLRAHPGQVSFPGGRLDPGDAGPVAAALREAVEETGLDPSGIEVLGALPELVVAPSQHVVTPVIGWWTRPSPVRAVSLGESQAVFRVPVAELLDPARRGVTVLRREGEVFRGPAFEVRAGDLDYLVWGFTAMVLHTLFERLGWGEAWDESRELALPAG